MKVKVVKSFNDKTADLVTRVVDDEFDVTEQRAEELIKGGYVEKVEEKEQEHKKDDSALNQTPPEPEKSDENPDDSAEETTPESESKPEPKKSAKAKKNEKKD